MMKAAGAMTRDVICIRPEDMLDDAYTLMTEWNIRHLPVVKDGLLAGILSDRDVLLHGTRRAGTVTIPRIEVASIMTTHPVTCRPSSSVSYVAGLMVEYKIDCVPVTDVEGRLVGLVTSTDLLQLLRDREDDAHKVLPFEFKLRPETLPATRAATA